MLNFTSRSGLTNFIGALACALTFGAFVLTAAAEGKPVRVSCEVLAYSQPGEPSAVTCRGINTDQPTRYLIHDQSFFLQSRYYKEGFIQFNVESPPDENLLNLRLHVMNSVVFCFFLLAASFLIPSAYFKKD